MKPTRQFDVRAIAMNIIIVCFDYTISNMANHNRSLNFSQFNKTVQPKPIIEIAFMHCILRMLFSFVYVRSMHIIFTVLPFELFARTYTHT